LNYIKSKANNISAENARDCVSPERTKIHTTSFITRMYILLEFNFHMKDKCLSLNTATVSYCLWRIVMGDKT